MKECTGHICTHTHSDSEHISAFSGQKEKTSTKAEQKISVFVPPLQLHHKLRTFHHIRFTKTQKRHLDSHGRLPDSRNCFSLQKEIQVSDTWMFVIFSRGQNVFVWFWKAEIFQWLYSSHTISSAHAETINLSHFSKYILADIPERISFRWWLYMQTPESREISQSCYVDL